MLNFCCLNNSTPSKTRDGLLVPLPFCCSRGMAPAFQTVLPPWPLAQGPAAVSIGLWSSHTPADWSAAPGIIFTFVTGNQERYVEAGVAWEARERKRWGPGGEYRRNVSKFRVQFHLAGIIPHCSFSFWPQSHTWSWFLFNRCFSGVLTQWQDVVTAVLLQDLARASE